MQYTMPMLRPLTACLALVFCACPKAVHGQGSGPRIEAKADPVADSALAQAKTYDALIAVRKTYPTSTAGQEALYRAGALAFEDGEYLKAKKALDELVFENPLHPMATQARLKSGLASVELKAYRDAFQVLQPLVERLDGDDRRLAEDALAKAAAGTQQFGEALKAALKSLEGATGEAETKAGMARLEDVIETKTNFTSLAEAWLGMSKAHPAWPMVSFKMARVYFHLRDWQRLDETLRSLINEAPESPYAQEAKAMQARVARRGQVRPKAIGAILPLSGKLKPVGDAVQRALTMALKGSDIELIVKDSGNDSSVAAKLVEQLTLDEGVMAIIGPVGADDSKRAALVAEELQVPLISLSRVEELTKIGPHVFRTMVTNSQQAEALVDYAMGTLGMKSFAVLYPNIGFGAEMSNAFWDAVEAKGGLIRGAETYEHDQTSFTSEAKRLVGRYYLEDRADYYEKLRDAKEGVKDERLRRKAIEKARDAVDPIIDFEALLIPDSWQKVALVAPALAVEEVVTNACDKKDVERIQKTTGKNKLKTVLLLGPATWASPKGNSGDPQLLERGGKYVLCSVYVDGFYEGSERPKTKAFVSAFREAHRDVSITLVDAVAYDTGGIVREVMEKGQPQNRTAFREALRGIKGYQGATGSISFDETGEARRDLFLLNVTQKGIKELNLSKPEG